MCSVNFIPTFRYTSYKLFVVHLSLSSITGIDSIMYRLSLLVLTVANVALALPTTLKWSSPLSCDRQSSSYDFDACTSDIDHLIRSAQESINAVEIVGMKLDDVIRPFVRSLSIQIFESQLMSCLDFLALTTTGRSTSST